MDWFDVRAHYIKCLARSGLTQAQVGRAGGLAQSTIHKLMKNDTGGPSVETLLRAIRGLGMVPSEFFQLLEQTLADPAPARRVAPAVPPPDLSDEEDDTRDAQDAHDVAYELRQLRREVAELRRVILARLGDRRGPPAR